MIYQLTKTFSKSGTEGVFEKECLQLTRGLIWKFEVYFPPGSCGLVRIKLMENEHQLYPSTPDELFRGENNTISFDDTYLIKDPPFVLTLQGYNLDTVYDHVVFVRIGFTSKDDLILRYLPPSLNEIIDMLNQSTIQQQEKVVEDSRKNLKRIKELELL